MKAYGVCCLMRRLRPPPDVKVLEAAGAIGDGRVEMVREGSRVLAHVDSSTGDRRYFVVVELPREGRATVIYVYSDDNGTRFRGYIGYPIISILMLLNILPRNTRLEAGLRGIKWKELNERFKRYSITKEYALRAASRLIPVSEAIEYVRNVMSRLRGLHIYYLEELAKH